MRKNLRRGYTRERVKASGRNTPNSLFFFGRVLPALLLTRGNCYVCWVYLVLSLRCATTFLKRCGDSFERKVSRCCHDTAKHTPLIFEMHECVALIPVDVNACGSNVVGTNLSTLLAGDSH